MRRSWWRLGWLGVTLFALAACSGGATQADASMEPTSGSSAPVRAEASPAREIAATGSLAPPTEARMDLQHMDRVVRDMGTNVESNGRVWQLELLGRSLIVVTDSRADRMRVISAVIRSDQLSEEALRVVLAADFHTALDARYAISDGVLYSAFIHPLSSLTEEELRSGLRQTATLANNFGTSFSSGELVFGAPAQPAPPGRSL